MTFELMLYLLLDFTCMAVAAGADAAVGPAVADCDSVRLPPSSAETETVTGNVTYWPYRHSDKLITPVVGSN